MCSFYYRFTELLDIPKGIVVRRARGGPGVYDAFIEVATKYRFSGYYAIRSYEFFGFVLIEAGELTLAKYEGPEGLLRGHRALQKIKELSEREDVEVELHGRVNIEEIKYAHADGSLEGEEDVGELDAWAEEGFDVTPLRELMEANSPVYRETLEAYRNAISRARELLARLSTIKEGWARDLEERLKKSPLDWELVYRELEEREEEEKGVEEREIEVYEIAAGAPEAVCPVCGEKLEYDLTCAKCGFGREDGLSHKYRMDNFVVGEGNRVAYRVAVEVLKNLGGIYNPLIIVADTGLGKTHLLNAIGVEVKRAGKRALYIQATDAGRVQPDPENVDVLLVDDFQLLSEHPGAQEEFLKVLDRMLARGRQVVVASDRKVENIPNVISMLRSRLVSGVTVVINPPNYITRLKILQKKAAEAGAEIPEDVIKYLAMKGVGNVRELEGLLKRLLAFARITGRPPDLSLAKEVLGEVGGAVMEEGNSYVFISPNHDRFYLMLEEMTDFGKKVLCLTRTNPHRIMKSYGRKMEIVWLTTRDSERFQTMEPSLERIFFLAEDAIRERKVVAIDGIEYLISENGFDLVLQFIRRMVDAVAESSAIFVVYLSPYTIGERELHLIEREMIPLSGGE